MIPYLGWRPLWDNVEEEFKKYYTISIWTARYPAIDPNIVHDADELRQSGYVLFDVDEDGQHCELLADCSVATQVSYYTYDFDLMQREYRFRNRPALIQKDQFSAILGDGETKKYISTKSLQKYLVEVQHDAIISYAREICAFSVSKEYFAVLKHSIGQGRSCTPRIGGYYQLSPTQLDDIDAFCKRTHGLMDKARECPDLEFFIKFDIH